MYLSRHFPFLFLFSVICVNKLPIFTFQYLKGIKWCPLRTLTPTLVPHLSPALPFVLFRDKQGLFLMSLSGDIIDICKK